LNNKRLKVILLGSSNSVHLVRWAKGLASRGIDISVITLGGDPIDGITTYTLPSGKSRARAYFRHLGEVKGLIDKLKPDLIHAHYATGFGLWGYYSKFHPYIVSTWGSDIVSFPNNLLKKSLLRRILTSADAITATSFYLKDKSVQLFPPLEPRISIIPFGVEIPVENIEKKDNDKVRLVFFKAHEKIYGPDILLAAMQQAIKVNPNVYLTVAGRGSMTEKLKKQSKRLGIDDHVNFYGYVEHDRIFSFLGGHDIMVMPSLQEAFGVAVLEASAVGLPVIAGDVGGVPEILLPEMTGLLVPPGDTDRLAKAIIRLAGNADLRKQMGIAGRKMVAEKYRWDISLDKMAELYEKTISISAGKN
jgi:glycosyltransferase involved in cell wall biosynthesis